MLKPRDDALNGFGGEFDRFVLVENTLTLLLAYRVFHAVDEVAKLDRAERIRMVLLTLLYPRDRELHVLRSDGGARVFSLGFVVRTIREQFQKYEFYKLDERRALAQAILAVNELMTPCEVGIDLWNAL